MDLKAGDAEPSLGKTIKEIIVSDTDFVVYMDTDGGIQWVTSTEIGSDFGKIQNQISYWESICNKLFTKEDKEEGYAYKALLAEGLARILHNNNRDDAQSIIDSTSANITKQGTQILRQEYIKASLAATGVVLSAVLIVFAIQEHSPVRFSGNALVIVLTALCGGIGSFVSTMSGLTAYSPDISLSKKIYWFDGALRVAYGVLAGFIIALGIKANLVLGTIGTDHNIYAIPFMGLLSGASEKILPSIIGKMEEKIGTP